MTKIRLPTVFISSVICFIGEYWNLLIILLLLNLIDIIIRIIKARKNKELNIAVEMKGLIKKIYQWLLIILSFIMSTIFEEVGKIINMNFSISVFLGWYVYTFFVINEFKSIIENLISLGCNVPKILMDGLEIANKLISKK